MPFTIEDSFKDYLMNIVAFQLELIVAGMGPSGLYSGSIGEFMTQCGQVSKDKERSSECLLELFDEKLKDRAMYERNSMSQALRKIFKEIIELMRAKGFE